jgi:hypothetical protein
MKTSFIIGSNRTGLVPAKQADAQVSLPHWAAALPQRPSIHKHHKIIITATKADGLCEG